MLRAADPARIAGKQDGCNRKGLLSRDLITCSNAILLGQLLTESPPMPQAGEVNCADFCSLQ